MRRTSPHLACLLMLCVVALSACDSGPGGAADAELAAAEEAAPAVEAEEQAEQEGQLDYLEFPATDIEETKRFYSEVFGWEFTDYGPGYTSFLEGRLAGGFTVDREVSAGGLLFVLYSADLAAVESRVRASGGVIVRDTFEFPGGRRFHFVDPSGNELAVWSDR